MIGPRWEGRDLVIWDFSWWPEGPICMTGPRWTANTPGTLLETDGYGNVPNPPPTKSVGRRKQKQPGAPRRVQLYRSEHQITASTQTNITLLLPLQVTNTTRGLEIRTMRQGHEAVDRFHRVRLQELLPTRNTEDVERVSQGVLEFFFFFWSSAHFLFSLLHLWLVR